MEKQSICIIGAGNLGQSLAKGLISQGFTKSNSLYLTRRKTKVIEYLAQQNVTITDDNEANNTYKTTRTTPTHPGVPQRYLHLTRSS